MLILYASVVITLLNLIYHGIIVYRQGVPGPWYTNFTSIPLKYNEFMRNRRLWIHALHEKYGPTVRLEPNEVSFASLEGMKEIYQSGGSGYEKTEFYDLFKQYNHRTMFTMLERNQHAQRRKLFAERYSMTNVIRPEISDGIEARASLVMSQVQDAAMKRSSLDVYVTLHCYALDCAAHFLFGAEGINSLRCADDMEFMKELSYHDSLRQRLVEHYWPYLNRIGSIFRPKITTRSRQYVLDKAQRLNPTPESLIARLRLANKAGALTIIESAAECMDHMAAGIDTTGDALCFLMHELSLPRSSGVQNTLHDEIKRCAGAKLEELVYLDAVVKEGLRLFPPIPMSLPRYVPAGGRTIAGHCLPGGITVSCQAYSLHLLNTDTFPDPDRFWPERWLQEQGKAERNRLFFAFSTGGRGCIGKNLAIVEMKTLLRKVYGDFSTLVDQNKICDMSIDDQIIASRPRDQTCSLLFMGR